MQLAVLSSTALMRAAWSRPPAPTGGSAGSMLAAVVAGWEKRPRVASAISGASTKATAPDTNGPHLTRARPGELPSEGTVIGAGEVPSEGQPLIFLNDHPTTIGYPTIATLRQESIAACAQLRPGQRVRLSRALL